MNSKKCKMCGTEFDYKPEQCYWKEYGTYSVKLIKCSNCECINVIQTVEDSGLHVNTDKRYY